MPDRERDLERELRELGALIDYPPTPDVALSARTLLDEANDRPSRFQLAFPTLRWAAVAAAFVLLVAVPTLYPGLRATVGDWFVARDIQSAGGPAVDSGSSERQQEANAPAAGVSKGGASRARTPRFSGGRITLRQAQARMEGALLLPRTPKLGKPDEVYAGGTSRLLEPCRTPSLFCGQAPPRPRSALEERRRGPPTRSRSPEGASSPHRGIGELRSGNRSGPGSVQGVGWAEDGPVRVGRCSAGGTRLREVEP